MPASVINHERYVAIHAMRRGGMTFAQIADILGVGSSTVERVCYSVSPYPKRDPRRCSGCGALVVTEKCLLCGVRAGTARELIIGDANDPEDTPDEDELQQRMAAVQATWSPQERERRARGMFGEQRGGDGWSTPEVNFSQHRNGAAM